MKIRSTKDVGRGWASPCFAAWVSVLCVALSYSPVRAQERNVAGASEAFSKAQQAELRGDFADAASHYAVADEMAPAAEALRGAMRTAQQAGLNATAATHAETLLSRENDQKSRSLAEDVLRSTAPQLTHLHVTCDAPCKVLIDGRITASRLAQDHKLYVRPGERGVSASFESGNAPTQSASLQAGSAVDFSFVTPIAAAPPLLLGETLPEAERKSGRRKLSPWYFGTVGTLTVVAGGLTVWSGLKVNSKHDDYDPGAPDAKADYDDGRKLEKQTNALIGVTSGLAVATVVLAVFTDFKGRDSSADKQVARAPSMTMAATRQGAVMGLSGWF